MKFGPDLVGFHRFPLYFDEIRHGSDRTRSDHLPWVDVEWLGESCGCLMAYIIIDLNEFNKPIYKIDW